MSYILYLQIEQILDAYQSKFATYFCNLSLKMAKNAIFHKKSSQIRFEVKYPLNHSGNPFKRYFGTRYS